MAEQITEKMTAFKAMRTKRGYSQSVLAADTGLSLRLIQHADQNGASGMACGSARKIAKVLHCLIEDLLDDEEYTTKRRGRSVSRKDSEDSPE